MTDFFSPIVRIYLEIGPATVRLSDVLLDSATLYDSVSYPPGTECVLVICVDDEQHRRPAVIDAGISPTDKFVTLRYI